MSDHVEQLKARYARWHESKGASIDDWLSILAPGARIGSLANGAAGAEFTAGGVGVEAARAYLEGLNQAWEMIEYQVHDMIADGDRVVVLGHCSWRSRADGRELHTPKADIWRFAGDKATEFYEFYDTAAVLGMT